MLTRDEVIKARQSELINEVVEIEQRIVELTNELERLALLKEQRAMEYRLLEQLGERSCVDDLVNDRKSRVSFEDCLITLYERVGRPLRMREIIDEMEKFGYQWSNYWRAYSYIRSLDIVQSTGARGYYNIIRTRGW